MTIEVVCLACLAVNRVPEARMADDPVCGRCRAQLLSGEATEVGDQALQAIVDRSKVPVVVDFWSPWCGPCRAMAPHYERAARALKGKALLLKVNSDQSDKAGQWGIRSIPTLLRFEAGREVGRVAGVMSGDRIVAFAG